MPIVDQPPRPGSIEAATRVVADIAARITWLLETHNLWGPDSTYTFPDGLTWHRPGDSGWAVRSATQPAPITPTNHKPTETDPKDPT